MTYTNYTSNTCIPEMVYTDKRRLYFIKLFHPQSQKHQFPPGYRWICFVHFAKCTSIDFNSRWFCFCFCFSSKLFQLFVYLHEQSLNGPHARTFLVRTDVEVLKSRQCTEKCSVKAKNTRFCTQTKSLSTKKLSYQKVCDPLNLEISWAWHVLQFEN